MAKTVACVVALMVAFVPVTSEAGNKKKETIAKSLRYAKYLMLTERDYKAAIQEYERVVKLDRKHHAAHLAMAAAYGKLGQWEKATKIYQKLVKFAPRDRAAWHSLGKAYLRGGDKDKALDAFEKSLDLDQDFGPALIAAGDLIYARYRSDNKDAKLKTKVVDLYSRYLKATRARKGFDAARVERIVAEMEQGPVEAAFLDGRRLYNRAFTTRRRMHLMFEQAYTKLDDVLKSKPNHASALFYQGLIHMSVKSKKLHDPEKAIKKLALAGDFAPALAELGRYERRKDDLSAAQTYLERAVKIDVRHQKSWYELGVVHKLADRRDEAVKALQQAVDVDSNSDIAANAVVELARLAPQDVRVRQHYRKHKAFKADVFDSEKYRGNIEMLEQRLGGVNHGSVEAVWLDEMMRRMLDASELKVPMVFEVKVTKTKMVNAFATPNGYLYFTQGFLDFVHKNFPDQPMSVENAVIAAVMGHEITHVTKEHIIRSSVFREAMDSKSGHHSSLVTVTRTHEIEADREGMKLMFLAGYDPRWAVKLHEAYARVLGEVPSGLDHPTFDERIHYLEEYWSNEMAFAFASFSQGVGRLQEAARMETNDLNKAATLYQEAIADFKRFTIAFKRTKEALNNLGLAHAKLGLFELARTQPKHAMARWYTEFSVESDLALKFVPLTERRKTRGAAGGEKATLPPDLVRARTMLMKALSKDEGYSRARLNLAVVYLASGDLDSARTQLAKVGERCEKECEVGAAQLANLQGIVEAEKGRIDDAVEHFEASLKEVSEAKSAPPRIFNMARALDKAGRKDDAIEAYRKFLETVGNDSSSWAIQARTAVAKLKD